MPAATARRPPIAGRPGLLENLFGQPGRRGFGRQTAEMQRQATGMQNHNVRKAMKARNAFGRAATSGIPARRLFPFGGRNPNAARRMMERTPRERGAAANIWSSFVGGIAGYITDSLGITRFMNSNPVRALSRQKQKGPAEAQRLAMQWEDERKTGLRGEYTENAGEITRSQEIKTMHNDLVKYYAMEKEIDENLNKDVQTVQERLAISFEKEPMLGMMLGDQGAGILVQFYALMRSGNIQSRKELESFMRQYRIKLRSKNGKMLILINEIPLEMEKIYGKARIDFMTEYLQGIEGIQKKRHMFFEAGRKSESIRH